MALSKNFSRGDKKHLTLGSAIKSPSKGSIKKTYAAGMPVHIQYWNTVVMIQRIII